MYITDTMMLHDEKEIQRETHLYKHAHTHIHNNAHSQALHRCHCAASDNTSIYVNYTRFHSPVFEGKTHSHTRTL